MRITHRCESDRDVCDLMEASVAEFVCIDCLSQAPEVRTCYRTSTCDLKQETHVSQILSRAARISIQTPKYPAPTQISQEEKQEEEGAEEVGAADVWEERESKTRTLPYYFNRRNGEGFRV